MLRFAPSPTGDMPIGDMRIALINYIMAKQTGQPFAVRVEDTDKGRTIEGKDQEILDILKNFAIEHDQLVYQSDYLARHQQFAVSLVEQGKAFICLCTPEELEKERETAETSKETYRYSGRCMDVTKEEYARVREEKIPYVIRIKQPDVPIIFEDAIKGRIETAPSEVDSFVILRADGTPTYNFACACDDMLMDVSMIIRSEEHVSDTPRQIHIKNALGYTKTITYAHLPIILNDVGKKMSADDTGGSIKWMLEQGFLLDTIINYLLLIGNHPPETIFTLPDAIEWFSLEKLSKDPARFDADKLRFINRAQLAQMDDKKISSIFGFADADIGKLVKLYLEEANTITELDPRIKAIFTPKACDGEWGESMQTIAGLIQEAPMFDSFDELKEYITESAGLKDKQLSKPLRLLMTGADHGPELSDVYPLIKPYLTEIARCQH